MRGINLIMAVIVGKGNAVNYERTLQNCFCPSHGPAIGSLRKEQLIASQFAGYSINLDTEAHIGPREGTKVKQGCHVIQKEVNRKDVDPTYRLMSPTYRNFPRKN
jgi:hypothetical protein